MSNPEASARGPKRILVVEDDPVTSRAMTRALSSAGFAVTAHPSCRAARAASGPFDCGVFDVQLGDGCGIELARELLSRRVVGRVVFHTGQADADVATEARELGPVMAKVPTSDTALVNVVSAIVADG
jgi:DNA-binding response OmpR family regulator